MDGETTCVTPDFETPKVEIKKRRRSRRRIRLSFLPARNARRGWQARLVSVAVLLSILAGMISPVAAAPGRPVASSHPTANAPASGAKIASGADSRRASAPSRAPSAAGSPVPCDSLSPNPSRFKGTGLVDCLQYSNQHLNGADYSLYYPVEWEPNGGWGYGYLDPAQEAIEQSVKTFSQYGTMGNVVVVFSLLDLDHGTDYANSQVQELLTTQACTVVIFTLMAELSFDSFRQVLAHEIFHCFEYWNLPEQFDLSNRKWWVEGLAEYFSNVAYPSVNFEWTRMAAFDNGSEDVPLTQMSYEACVFWQFLGNEIGNDGTLLLLHALPTSGGEREQQQALRDYPGFADLYQRFAEQYVDKTIADTGGGMIPINPQIYSSDKIVRGSGRIEFEPDPFTIGRFSWKFAPDPKIVIEVVHGTLKYGARSTSAPGTWAEMRKTVDCDDPREWTTAVTSLAIAPEKDAKIVFNFNGFESDCKDNVCGTPSASTPTTDGGAATVDDSCEADVTDTCLIGTWAATDVEASFVDAYAVVNPAIDLNYSGIDGSLTYTFGETDVTVSADEFVIKAGATIAGTNADIEIGIDGSTSAPYHVNAGGLSGEAEMVPNDFTMTATVLLDGEEVYSDDIGDFLLLVGGSFDYSCQGNSLKLALIMPDGRGLPPMTLERQP
jgi:hypothetical protein